MTLKPALTKHSASIWCPGDFRFVLCRPIIMGVLNVTPDSFSDGGKHADFDSAVSFALDLINEGADIIDVGGESTRPGSAEVSVEEELRRTLSIVKALADEGICVSIDTRHAEVAQACVDAGASVINDVTGFRDEDMIRVAASCEAGVVSMHMLKNPDNMQVDVHYDDFLPEVITHLKRSVNALESAGVDRRRICVDPGPGFAKNSDHNLELLANFDALCELGYPVLSAYSRKSTLGKITGKDDASKRIFSTAATSVCAYLGGAQVFRVHDVSQNIEALKVATNMVAKLSINETFNPMHMGSSRVLISLGSNMGNSVENIVEATKSIDAVDGIDVIASSSIYESEPAYYQDQDRFANSALWAQTSLEPDELLDKLHEIENEFFRERSVKNGPRTLDLDLLDYEGVASSKESLMLPHPRIMERDFVIRPLLELSKIMKEFSGGYVCIAELAPESVSEDNPFALTLADGSLLSSEKVSCGEIKSVILKAKEVF